MFRQRVVPSLDTFRSIVVGTFGRSMEYDPYMERYEKKFIFLVKRDVKDAVATL